MKAKKIETLGLPILSGNFDEMQQKVKNYFDGNGILNRNSTCRRLYVYKNDNSTFKGYIVKQENRVWNLYKTLI